MNTITLNYWIKVIYLAWKLRHWGIWRLRYINVWMAQPPNDLFTTKMCKYDLWDNSLSKVLTTNHGPKSFKDYGAKIWNLLPESCKGATSLGEFKVLIKSWNGSKRFVRYVFILHESDYTCEHYTAFWSFCCMSYVVAHFLTFYLSVYKISFTHVFTYLSGITSMV